MATPPWQSVSQGSSFASANINQFHGSHNVSYLNQGASQVAYTVAATGTQATNTGSAARWLAQPFSTAVGQTTITRVELFIGSTGTGADTTLELRTNNSGNPSNTTLWTCTIPADFEPGTASYISIPCNVSGLTASTLYHLVIDGTSNTTNFLDWSTAVTSVNAGLKSASGTGSWSSVSATFLFNVFNGADGVLRNTAEDGTTSTTSGVTQTNGAPARWIGQDYNQSNGSTTIAAYREYTGSLRSVRSLTYSNGILVGMA